MYFVDNGCKWRNLTEISSNLRQGLLFLFKYAVLRRRQTNIIAMLFSDINTKSLHLSRTAEIHRHRVGAMHLSPQILKHFFFRRKRRRISTAYLTRCYFRLNCFQLSRRPRPQSQSTIPEHVFVTPFVPLSTILICPIWSIIPIHSRIHTGRIFLPPGRCMTSTAIPMSAWTSG